ncbi:MAG: hypothetical protein J5780_04425, partial [Treponema sp.]|nr:hypothetical protein [Treponema sp.]
MKLTKKIFVTFTVLSFLAGTAFAQDFGFDGESGFDDYSSYDTSEPAVVISGKVEADARVFPQRNNTGYDTHDYSLDMNALQNKAVSADPSLSLGVDYSGAFSDFSG